MIFIDIPIKSSQSISNFEDHWSGCHIWLAVSLTPPTTGQRCQWPSGVFVKGLHSWIRSVTDTAQLRSATQRGHWHCPSLVGSATVGLCYIEVGSGSGFFGVLIRIQSKWPVSVTLKGGLPVVSGVIDTTHQSMVSCVIYRWPQKIRFESRISWRSRILYETALTRGSGAQIELLEEKKVKSWNISWRDPIKILGSVGSDWRKERCVCWWFLTKP
jgi:hypothetical protein